MIRDQANKTLDTYLQRVRKHGNTMADTVLPPTAHAEVEASKSDARIGTPNDKSWAGWAISSFTNKITTANGEIQPTLNGKAAETDPTRSASVPRPAKSSPPAQLELPKDTRPAPKPLGRSLSDQPVPVLQMHEPEDEEEEEEADDVFDAWGAMDDDNDEDPFTAAVASPKPLSPDPAHKPAPVPYDDGGEPDFAGWLAAQSKAKAKKGLPKGLNKTSTTNAGTTRSTLASTAKPRTVAAPAKTIDTKPKEEEIDDDWGAWD